MCDRIFALRDPSLQYSRLIKVASRVDMFTTGYNAPAPLSLYIHRKKTTEIGTTLCIRYNLNIARTEEVRTRYWRYALTLWVSAERDCRLLGIQAVASRLACNHLPSSTQTFVPQCSGCAALPVGFDDHER